MCRLVLVLVLAVFASAPALADQQRQELFRPVDVRLELLPGSGGVYAVAVVESPHRLELSGTVDIWVNGNAFELASVATSGVQYVATLLGPVDTAFAACAHAEVAYKPTPDDPRLVGLERCATYEPPLPRTDRPSAPIRVRGDADERLLPDEPATPARPASPLR